MEMETNQNRSQQMLETDDPLDIRKDFIFKAVFTKETPYAKQALSKLVSALIGRTISIETLWANEVPIENAGDRNLRFDINCRAENGERINVEMGFDTKPYELVRIEFHLSKLYAGQNIKGRRKNFSHLKRTYQISILSKKIFFADKEFFHSFEYFDPVRQVSLRGKTKIIILELIKVKRFSGKNIDKMSIPELWAYYFEYLTDKTKRSIINRIAEKEEGIYMANEVLLSISRNEAEREEALSQEKHELDRQSALDYEWRRGRRRGKQEIINLLKSGKSPEDIIRDNGG